MSAAPMHTEPPEPSPTKLGQSLGQGLGQAQDDPSASDGVPILLALVGNPNTGKTTLFNGLCGLRHKTSNFPGTTQEARIGTVRTFAPSDGAEGGRPGPIQLVDLPGVYALDLEQSESRICRDVLAGTLPLSSRRAREPDGVCVVIDATNLPRNMTLVGEVLRRRLAMVVIVTMVDLARRGGLRVDVAQLSERLGCPVVECNARSGEGVSAVAQALTRARIPHATPPGDRAGLEAWAEALADQVTLAVEGGPGASTTGPRAGSQLAGSEGTARVSSAPRAAQRWTDRLDHVLVHPVSGMLVFLATMAGLFWMIFKLATYPMDWIEQVFVVIGAGIRSIVPEGLVQELLTDGVVAGISGVLVFLPQICLLFFLISLLEDTGYLARATLLMNRVLRPFGLPGQAFVPLLSSHACALPGIMSARAVPDRRERLATILVAPFMSCSARVPVYVLLTTLLFPDEPGKAALAFMGCYAGGVVAGLGTALVFRRTLLKGPSRALCLELPTYKLPSVRTALITTYDRAVTFLRSAGTNILAICLVLWWLSAFPHVPPPDEAVALREQAAALVAIDPGQAGGPTGGPAGGQVEVGDGAGLEQARSVQEQAQSLEERAALLEASHARASSFAGQLGRLLEPVFTPLGFDWQLTVGVLASFAAREVFVATMAVIVTGTEDLDDAGLTEQLGAATRADGVTPLFDPATSWSLLVFYILAMQCLPTLAVTAREAGGVKWALLQLGWMSALAYAAAWVTFMVVR
ncbi:MAG: ferrous iron transporter B [Planctomycetota bacterium]|nr:ferrous iron transporter B [Planctomycetota bacterium]